MLKRTIALISKGRQETARYIVLLVRARATADSLRRNAARQTTTSNGKELKGNRRVCWFQLLAGRRLAASNHGFGKRSSSRGSHFIVEIS